MAWSQDVKFGTAQVVLWKKAAKSSIRRMMGCGENAPIDRSGECPEEGDQVSESRLEVIR